MDHLRHAGRLCRAPCVTVVFYVTLDKSLGEMIKGKRSTEYDSARFIVRAALTCQARELAQRVSANSVNTDGKVNWALSILTAYS